MDSFNFFTGALNFAVLFIICFIIVFGIKVFLLFLGINIKNPFKILPRSPAKSKSTIKKEETNSPKKRTYNKGKTLIIDPDDVSRIYVKRDK